MAGWRADASGENELAALVRHFVIRGASIGVLNIKKKRSSSTDPPNIRHVCALGEHVVGWEDAVRTLVVGILFPLP